MVSQKKAWLILIIIILFSGIIRLINLNALPLNWDEVSHGYNAYSLLLTGRDQWNQAFPLLNFRAYGDYPTTLNLYMSVLPLKVFGMTDFALRLPHILIGILSVVLAYIAAFRWQKNRLLALFAAFFVALEPWTFFPSRAVFQSNWTVFLLFLGLGLYFSKKTIPAVLIWGLSLFAYHNTRIFIPLLLVFLLFKKSVRINKKVLGTVISVMVLGIGILWFSQARARGNWVGILDSGAIAYIEQQRNISRLPRPAYPSSV